MPAQVVNVFNGNVNLQIGETISPTIPIDDDITRANIVISRQGMSTLSKTPDVLRIFMEVSLDNGLTWIQRKGIGIEGGDLAYQFGIAANSFTGFQLIDGVNRVGRARVIVSERFKFKVDIDLLTE